MKAAAAFAEGLASSGAIERVDSVVVTLYGSLAFTGKGHATDKAVVLGLSGERPDTITPLAPRRWSLTSRRVNRSSFAGGAPFVSILRSTSASIM
jgi:L-serine dehydratase